MSQPAVELILMRQLASYLTVPMFVVGADERLLFYNEAAEALLGKSYDEAGQMALDDLPSLFNITGDGGTLLPAEQQPLAIALRQGRPAHSRLTYRALNGTQHQVEVTAFPLEGQAGRHVGAVAIFWEPEAS